jgi:cytochrome d ubiquinol oxidase subunit I
MTTILSALTPQPVPDSLVGNSVAVAIVALVHLQFAAFIQGASFIALVNEFLSMVRGDDRHERIAHGLIKASASVFGFGSALAILWVVFIFGGLWGQFFLALSRITFWMFVFEAGLFLTEIWLLYALYANWDRLRPYRTARLGLMVLLFVALYLQQFFIDVVASYMLTPNRGDVSQMGQILNPTQLPLTIHRTFGNVAWCGAVIAAWSAVKYLRASRPATVAASRAAAHPARSVGAMSVTMYGHPTAETQDAPEATESMHFWDYAGQWGAVWALGGTLFQPFVGYSYAKEVQLHAYPAWYDMMFGGLSNVFLTQITLLGLIFVLSSLYLLRRQVASGAPLRLTDKLMFGVLVASTIVAATPSRFALTYSDVAAAHLDRPWWDGGLLNPLGTFIPNKVFALAAFMVAGLVLLTRYLRSLSDKRLFWGQATRGSQVLLILLGVTVSVMMMVMGFIREHARNPYLINGEITISQQHILQHPVEHGGPPTTTNPGP